MDAGFPKSSEKSKYANYNPQPLPKQDEQRGIVAPGGKNLGDSLPMTPPKKSS